MLWDNGLGAIGDRIRVLAQKLGKTTDRHVGLAKLALELGVIHASALQSDKFARIVEAHVTN